MSLPSEINEILYYSDHVSQETKDQALKEIIEHHRNHGSVKAGPHPLLDKVVKGETTFQEEYEIRGKKIINDPEIILLMGGNFDLEKSMAIVDETIQRLYQ